MPKTRYDLPCPYQGAVSILLTPCWCTRFTREADSESSVALKTPPNEEAPKLKVDTIMSVFPSCLYLIPRTDSSVWNPSVCVGGNSIPVLSLVEVNQAIKAW